MEVYVPESVQAGSSFQVQVSIDKGELSNFSRFLQKLPYGLSASSLNSANADFTFKNQKVRLIWLKLPKSNLMTFSYSIDVDQRLKGEFDLKSLFSYIENNERKSVNVQSQTVRIIPSPDMPPDQIVDIREFEQAIIPDLTPRKEVAVSCIRQTPDLSAIADGIEVNLIINKGDKEKFAKIEEQIPAGFTAVDLETKDAIFTYKNQVAKFLWMNLPSESYFSVSYKLIPEPGLEVEKINIKGLFSYIENEKTISIDIIEEEFELKDKSEDEILRIITSIITSKQPSVIKEPELTAQKEPTKAADVTQTGQKVMKKPVSTGKPKIQKSDKTDLLKPEAGIYYRVQIAAGHKPVNIRRYFKKFNLEKTVKKEIHEGWHKYSVGSFNIYKESRDYRNYIWKTTVIDDAFVSAYNSGVRITVQEALMVANQKWYR